MHNAGAKGRWSRGSLTVETALCMPLILLVWMGTVSVCLFVHNRAWLTAAAYESAVTGSWDAVCTYGDVEEQVREKLRILLQQSLYGSRDIQTDVVKDGETLKVMIEGRHDTYKGLRWEFHIEGSRKLCRPVPFIRKAKILRETGRQLGGGS